MSPKLGEEGKLLAMLEHAKDLAQASTMQEIARATLDTVKTVLGYDLGTFGLVEGENLHFIESTGFPNFQGIRIPLDGTGITVRAVNTGETQRVDDVSRDPAHIAVISSRLGITTHSELDIPVKIGEEVVAVINLESEKPAAFTPHDATLVELLSEHVATAIQHNRQLEQLKASEEMYRELIESTLEPVIVIKGDTTLYMNEANARLLGYDSPAELIGRDHTFMYPPDEKARIREMATRRQKGETVPNRYMMKLLRKDGTIIEVETSVTLVNYRGQPTIVSFARDMSQWRHFEDQILALHTHSARLAAAGDIQTIVDATLDAVQNVLGFDLLSFLTVDKDSLYSIGSRGTHPVINRFPLDGKGITVKAAREKRSILVEDTTRNPDYIQGTVESLSELAVPVVLDGETVAILNVESTHINAFTENDRKLFEIITTHVASALERIRVREQLLAEQARNTRDLVDGANKIAAMVRHDLRAPLQTISNATFLIRDHPERLPEFTEAIDRSVAYADKILEDLRGMTGPSELQRTLVNLNDLVEASLAQTKIPPDVRVEVTHSDEFIAVSLDATRIRRALDNLVKNAVEAMPRGGTLTINTEKHPDRVTLGVADTGPGIPQAERPLIFKPFHTTKKAGTGLGLTSAKQAVEAHGGTIGLETETGKGATFTITIPTKNW
jgi:PAS domain S-box-containing protein